MSNRILIGILLCLMIREPAAAALHYTKTEGDQRETLDWTLSRQGEDWLVEANDKDHQFRNLCRSDGDTREWEIRGPGTRVEARAIDGALVITGSDNGKSIDTHYALDGLPWYQPLSFSLARFVETRKDSVEFWTIRPDNLQPIKMVALRKGVEKLAVQGRTLDADRVHIKPRGMLSMLWQADYWFADSGSCFIRYQSNGRIPGVANTLIELQSETADCPPPT